MKKAHIKLFACLLSLALLVSVLAACNAKSDAPAAYDSAATAETPAESPAEMPMAPEIAEETSAQDAALNTGGSSGNGETNTSPDLSQKIIYSAYLDLETTAFDDATQAIDKLVADCGGFVESANVDGNTAYRPDGTTRVENRTARYVLRVPSNRFEAALKQAGTIGNVTSSSRNAQNITSQFIDNEARLDSLRVQEDRLLAMMEKSTDVETLVALESRLSEVRYELESIERQLRNWQTQVDYSTIELVAREVEIFTPTAPVQRTFGEKLSTSFSDGMTRFGRGLQNMTIGLAGALPVLILLAALAVAAVIVVRRALRKRRAANQPPEPPQQEEK